VSQELQLFKKQVISVRSVAKGVFILTFTRDFSFIAGQVLAIDLIPDGKPRLYSIASGENDAAIEILFDEKPMGSLTPRLSRLQPGDSIYVSKPFGTFKPEFSNCIWIAAGTGIAPFVSIIRSRSVQNCTLIHGGKLDENFYYSDLPEQLLDKKHYIRCSSQQADTAHFNGRLTEWLINQIKLPQNSPYYLCGSAEMVVQVRDILISKGVPFKNIISETYF
jgi:ferredoxin/flavodoxin---NADP+ reductase